MAPLVAARGVLAGAAQPDGAMRQCNAPHRSRAIVHRGRERQRTHAGLNAASDKAVIASANHQPAANQPVACFNTSLGPALMTGLWRLAQRFTGQLKAIRLMHQAVEDAVGDGRIANLLVPLRHGQLAGEHRRAPPVAVIADLQKQAPLQIPQRVHGEVIHHQQVHLGERRQVAAQAAVGLRLLQVAEQFPRRAVQHAIAVPAGFVRQRLANQLLPIPVGR